MAETTKLNITQLVLAGGAYFGFQQYGAMYHLLKEKNITIKDIVSFHSTSVGSIISIILALEIDPEYVYSYFIHRPWDKVFAKHSNTMFDIYETKGFYKRSLFDDLLSPLLTFMNFSPRTTLKECYELTKKDMFFYSTKVNGFVSEVFHHSTHPDVLVLDAIYMSCCIPYVFEPLSYNDSFMIDGAFTCNFPYNQAIEYKKRLDIPGNLLCLSFDFPENNTSDCENCDAFTFGTLIFDQILHFIKRINETNTDDVQNEQTNYKTYHIKLSCDTLSFQGAYEAITNKDNRILLFDKGVNECTTYLQDLFKEFH